MNLYEVLGIERDATSEQIQAAYRKKALATHPDHGGDAEAYRQAAIAAETLLDDAKRARYDRTELFGDAAGIIEQTVAQLAKEAFTSDEEIFDPIRWMLDKIDGQRAEHRASKEQHERILDKAQRGIERIERENLESTNPQARAVIIGALESVVSAAKEWIAEDERNIAIGTEILTFLNGIRCKPELKRRAPYDSPSALGPFGNRGFPLGWTS